MAGNQERSEPPAAVNRRQNQWNTTALYIGDLEDNVTESQLYEFFRQIGPVESVRVCKPISSTEKSIAYGYVNYINSKDAETALQKLNFNVLNGKMIRVMQVHGNQDFGVLGNANVFIKNLEKRIDSKYLFSIFKLFGSVLSCKVATDDEGKSKGYGFVQFENVECARNAIKGIDGMMLNGKRLSVGPYLRREARVVVAAEGDEDATVFVKNLEEGIIDEDLRRVFGTFGKVRSVNVRRDEDGKSRCFGFVYFVCAEDASKAIEALNGVRVHEKKWYVGKTRKKGEVEKKVDDSSQSGVDKNPQSANLYLKNLDGRIDEEMLRVLFARFGSIASLKVQKYPNGTSQGVGFVAFSTSDEASKALAEMNGKVVAGKPLYVSIAERKDERLAKLHSQSQRPTSVPPSVTRPMNTPSHRPQLDQDGLYHKEQNSLIPQHGFGYPHQLAPAPDFFSLQNQQIISNTHHRMLPGVHGFSNGQGFQIPDIPMLGCGSGMVSVAPPHEAARAHAGLIQTLYLLVHRICPFKAADITDIILKMDIKLLIYLVHSPEALKATIFEILRQLWLLVLCLLVFH